MAEPKTTTGDYNSVYRAKVVENDDPEKMGRVRVQCPRVLGEYKSNWAKVCVPYALDDGGIIQIPRVGEVVWVMFEDGSPSKPIVVGQWWIPNETPLENDEYEDDEKRDRIRRYKTESGHTVTFFDKEGEEYVELETSKGHIIKFVDEDGEQKIKIEDINGNRIEMDTEEDDLNIKIDNDSNQEYGGDLNIQVEGETNITTEGDTNIDAGGDVNLQGGGPGIARLGDTVEVEVTSGSSAGTYTGSIISASGKAFSG